MKHTPSSRVAIICGVVGIIGVLLVLVVLAPVVAAILFIGLLIVGAVSIGRSEGGWKGFVSFAKSLLFGW